MLTSRNVIIAVVLVAVISVVAAAVSLLRPPGSEGVGGDTYGTRSHGLRAVYEIVGELGAPVERSPVPPSGILGRRMTLVLWAPHQKLVQVEPVYLRRVAEWVRAGGRVVVAPSAQAAALPPLLSVESDDADLGPESVLEELGLGGVGIVTVDLAAESSPAEQDESGSFSEYVERGRAARLVPISTVPAEGHGAWEPLGSAVASVAVPARQFQVLDTADSEPDALITAETPAGDALDLAALYRRGDGEIIVVGDPRLFENRFIARADNPVLAWHLLAAGRTVVFDEFYHGLTIRGNPLYLVARPPYGLIALAVLAALGVWLWRRAISLGPPLEPPAQTRRTVAEYVDAMARLFRRGRSSRPFLLREFRAGALWTLRHESGLPPGREHPDEVAAVLARQDPRRAEELRQAIATLDGILSSDRPGQNEVETVQALQRVSACL